MSQPFQKARNEYKDKNKEILPCYYVLNVIANREKEFFSSKLLDTIGKPKIYSFLGFPSKGICIINALAGI